VSGVQAKKGQGKVWTGVKSKVWLAKGGFEKKKKWKTIKRDASNGALNENTPPSKREGKQAGRGQTMTRSNEGFLGIEIFDGGSRDGGKGVFGGKRKVCFLLEGGRRRPYSVPARN